MKKALIIVDVQNDFLPGGALAVQKGDEVIEVINHLLTLAFDVKIASQDWHPVNHKSFASVHGKQVGELVQINHQDQTLWPNHCIQGSFGAELSAKMNISKIDRIFHKGTDPEVDSYSAFFDNKSFNSTGLFEYLKEMDIEEVYIAGLATDYCVKFTALDASKLGFKTHVFVDACRAVNLNLNDEHLSLIEMEKSGVIVESSKNVKF